MARLQPTRAPFRRRPCALVGDPGNARPPARTAAAHAARARTDDRRDALARLRARRARAVRQEPDRAPRGEGEAPRPLEERAGRRRAARPSAPRAVQLLRADGPEDA